ncbi:MAG: hypothetical protein IPL53_20545 [Ignavibacteria bacterium]|nr:hypothetical protein [Ignavibacteria bacterium]
MPALISGTNRNNKYYNITIQNVYNGIYLLSGSSTLTDAGNEIGTIDDGATVIGAGSPGSIGNGSQATWGIRTFAQGNLKIFNCEIKNVTCTGINSVDGIFVDNNSFSPVSTDTTRIYNNKVYNLLNSNTSPTSHRVYGIRVNNPANISSVSMIYNNFIYGLNNASANTSSRQLIGIYAQESGNGLNSVHNILFNSVRLSPSGISCQNSCFELGTTSGAVLQIYNNIFSNFTSAQTGNARHYCMVTPSGSYPGNAGSTSDHNDLYIANAVNGFTGLTGTTNRATLANWKNAFTPNQDVSSFSQDPGIISSTDLHIAAGINTQLESGSLNISGLEFDIDSDTRPGPSGSTNGGGTFPDVGADEFDGIPVDNIPPSISYSLLQNSSSISARVFQMSL